MSTVASEFKYIWEAEFEDGKIITQPHDDRYSKHVEGAEHNPSAFRDVKDYYENTSKLLKFSLIGEGNRITVDLTDGHFEINGVPFIAHEQMYTTEGKELQVAFWREVRRESDVTGTVQEDGSLQIEDEEVTRHFINRYFIGWQVVGEDKTITVAVA